MNNISNRRDPRASLRTDVEISASVREPGLGSVDAMILDLSITGFRMRCLTRLTGEKVIFLKLPSFAALESKVCWRDGDYFGCEFAQSLHPAVYNHIIAKYPSLQIAAE
ncbi:PilZ domain-containing protein [uncultured Parasphingorhabdus sp.]|uniref:PilZ domain-containing protein n=1 Tax=uncultured Parasphingorhabdus sp. TaxID=2709694 RepID=UPI0030DA3E7F|tara:strand:- start:20431 stop:20757 length:327 start_codon:yes stop_codon:yes gene_type:complete